MTEQAKVSGTAKVETVKEMPGPKKKQAEALSQNVQWMAETFGIERIGFLTITCGDWVGKKFVKVSDREEASRRFNSLMTHVVRKRYRCGVTVQERHADGGIHFHLICVAPGNLRDGFKWDEFDRLQGEVRAKKIKGWRGEDVGAAECLRAEWSHWRKVAERFGFGRCEMLPVRKNGQAVGRYVAKYVGKTWLNRKPEDKGARLVRYFGKWATPDFEGKIMADFAGDVAGARRCVKRAKFQAAKFQSMAPMAQVWRDCLRQVIMRCSFDGVTLTKENLKIFAGRRWSWHFTKKFNATEFFKTKRTEGVEKQRDEWQIGVLEKWKACQTKMHISDRGAEFWRVTSTSRDEERDGGHELIAVRRGNAAAVELFEGIEAAMESVNKLRDENRGAGHVDSGHLVVVEAFDHDAVGPDLGGFGFEAFDGNVSVHLPVAADSGGDYPDDFRVGWHLMQDCYAFGGDGGPEFACSDVGACGASGQYQGEN